LAAAQRKANEEEQKYREEEAMREQELMKDLEGAGKDTASTGDFHPVKRVRPFVS
jgi:hypothetical protein